ncbi:MAG: hypothetical protein LBR80_14915 [Deltaproteobacteria bacterium]|jgi:hypothetical protein|nr:hypothetical protein [Deltaproteobacteria bacterium]
MKGHAGEAGTWTAFRFKAGAYKLWAVAILVALSLCGAEVTFDGNRDVPAGDLRNHLVLSASMAESFLEGSFPPRVSPLLSDGLGNPYHQFYSPLSHGYVAMTAILLGDLVNGFTYGSVFILAVAFVYSFRLGRYLTLSDRCAVFAAFLFVTAPYLSTDRALRGNFAEYFAFCLLPAALYYNLRALPPKNFSSWARAVLATAAVLLAHLITGFYFLLFYAFFLLFAAAAWLVRFSHAAKASAGQEKVGFSGLQEPRTHVTQEARSRTQILPRAAPFLRKGLSAASVAVSAILLDMYCLGPVIFYDDIIMKSNLAGGSMAASAFMTPVLGVFSLTDTSWSFSSNLTILPRFQAGLLLLASFAAFVFFHARRGGAWTLSFALTGGLALLLVIRPEAFLYPPLKYVDIAQFSYRLLAVFTLAGMVAGALALRAFFRSSDGLTRGSESVAVLALAALSLALAAPYVYPRYTDNNVARRLNTADIYQLPRLRYGEDAYQRMPPAEEAYEWVEPDRVAVPWAGKAGDWTFSADLADYYRASGGPSGEVLLGVLYYPGLQDIEIKINGEAASLGLDTYWQRTDALRGRGQDMSGILHGLKISGAPAKGILEARVRFTGFRWANWTSLALSVFLLGGAVNSALRRRMRGRVTGARVSGDAERKPDGSTALRGA